MSKKKILHIPNYYPPHVGGIEDVCHSIVSATKNDYHHTVICFNDEKKTRKDTFEGIEVIRCGVIKKLFSQSLSFSYFSELKQVIKEFNPDLIHFHTPNPLASVYLLSAIPKKTKLIVHWHSDIIEQDLLYFFYKPIEKVLLKRADKIITTSPTYIPGSKALHPFIEKVVTLPNTVNTDKLDKKQHDDQEILRIKELYNNKKIIFTFGRHVTYKGLRHLIQSAPLISNEAIIVIAGRGPLSDELKSIPESSFVRFIGRVSDDELRYYLHAADIFAFPSITRNEAFGIALAEAMYCKLPSVTFTIPNSGVNWVCPDNLTGLEVENSNAESLALAINKLLGDPVLREKLAKNSHNRVLELFVTDAIKSNLDTLYMELLI